MSAAQNKEALRAVFVELAKGNGEPFIDLWADDFCWTVMGTTRWSREYRGKEAVLNELMKPLFSNFADQYTNVATHFVAEDDYVVVECRGNVTTKNGQSYNNRYCYVCRMENSRLKELKEYLDTELVSRVLEPPV